MTNASSTAQTEPLRKTKIESRDMNGAQQQQQQQLQLQQPFS